MLLLLLLLLRRHDGHDADDVSLTGVLTDRSQTGRDVGGVETRRGGSRRCHPWRQRRRVADRHHQERLAQLSQLEAVDARVASEKMSLGVGERRTAQVLRVVGHCTRARPARWRLRLRLYRCAGRLGFDELGNDRMQYIYQLYLQAS